MNEPALSWEASSKDHESGMRSAPTEGATTYSACAPFGDEPVVMKGSVRTMSTGKEWRDRKKERYLTFLRERVQLLGLLLGVGALGLRNRKLR